MPMGGYKRLIYKIMYRQFGYKCGFSIGADTCGYGLVLHHYGTVIVGTDNHIGNYANLLPSCISKSGSTFGDFLFMGYGAIVSRYVEMGNNVKVAANSVVNKSLGGDNVVIAGAPADVKKIDNTTWLEMYSGREGKWMNRMLRVEDLKKKMGL